MVGLTISTLQVNSYTYSEIEETRLVEPTTFYLTSLGCPKNRVDSEVILGTLTHSGYEPVQDPLEARVIVVNTCSFIESATQESVDTVLELAQAKQQGNVAFW